MVKKTEREITTAEKVMAVIIVVGLLVAGISVFLFLSERAKSKEVESGAGIDQLVFTRTGGVIVLEEDEEIVDVELYDENGEKIHSENKDETANVTLVQFEWDPKNKYRFDVNLRDGSKLSSVGYAPDKPQPYELFNIDYTDEFPKQDYHASVTRFAPAGGEVRISNSGEYVALALNDGRLSVVDLEKKQEIWSKYIEDYSYNSMRVSDDSNYVIVGGSSVNGAIYVFDIKNGEEVWSYETIQDIGKEEVGAYNPSVEIRTADDKIFAIAVQQWTETLDTRSATRSAYTVPVNETQVTHFRTKIYCFNLENGDNVWDFPSTGGPYDDWGDGVADRGFFMENVVVNKQGDYFYAQLGWWSADTVHLNGVIICFDATNGEILWDYEIPMVPLTSFSGVYSCNVSPDGKYLTLGTNDGRVFLFDNMKCIDQGYGSPEWVKDLGIPYEVNGVVVHTCNVLSWTYGEYVYAYIRRTMDELGMWESSDVTIDYSTRTMWVYELDGELKWNYKIGEGDSGSHEELPTDGKYMIMANRHNMMIEYAESKDSKPYNLNIHPSEAVSTYTIFDITKDSYDGDQYVCWRLPLDGATGSIGDISNDGQILAFLEVPLDRDPTGESPDITGTYALRVYT